MQVPPTRRLMDQRHLEAWHTSPHGPAPSWLGAARTVSVEDRQRQGDEREQNRPSSDSNNESRHSGKRNIR